MSSFDFNGNHNFDFKLTLDGYMLMLPSKGELICFVCSEAFYICNPSTQELVKLAQRPMRCYTDGDGIGFGYIKEKNEYVLVNARRYSCEVLRWIDGSCLKNCSWRVISGKRLYFFEGCGFLVKNSFYWIGTEGKTDCTIIRTIVSLDLGKQDFGSVEPPKGFDFERSWFLVELKGMLCFVESPADKSFMGIWVLNDSKNNRWVKEYNIEGVFNPYIELIIPLDIREGKILMNVRNERLEWYDVENKCFKRIDNLRSVYWTRCGLYIDGFSSLGTR